MTTPRHTRPINNIEQRKPVKFQKEERPNRFKMSMNPDPEMVTCLAGNLLPITMQEIQMREFGESAIVRGLSSTFKGGSLGFILGTAKYLFQTIPNKEASISFKDLGMSSLKTAASFGLQLGITDFIESSISYHRGKEKFYDKIIAGAVTGSIFGIPDGFEGMARGAAFGASIATSLAILQSVQS